MFKNRAIVLLEPTRSDTTVACAGSYTSNGHSIDPRVFPTKIY